MSSDSPPIHDVKPDREPTRVAISGFVGTAIEYYDFFIFGTAAALVFGQAFFPSLDPLSGTLASFATFAVAFVARPLGGILFGHFGDRLGRKSMLVISLLLMGVSTVAVGLLPGYDQIGVLAPTLLVALRFLQGIGLGGEFGGAMLMIAEHAPAERRGFFSSLAQLGPPVGLVLSSLTFLLLNVLMGPEAFLTWGWRIAFVSSALLVLVGMYIRLNVSESPVFKELTKRHEQVKIPLFELIRNQGWRLLLAAGPSLLSSVLFFLITTYSLSYGTKVLGVPQTTMLLVVVAVVVINAAVTVPIGGLSDRIGRRRSILIGIIGSALWAVPMFALVRTGDPLLMGIGFSVGIVLYTFVFAPLGAFLPELFDTRTRYTGTSVAFNIGAMLGGALAPSIATQLGVVTGNAWWVLPGYILAACIVALLCLTFLPETRNSDLNRSLSTAAAPDIIPPTVTNNNTTATTGTRKG